MAGWWVSPWAGLRGAAPVLAAGLAALWHWRTMPGAARQLRDFAKSGGLMVCTPPHGPALMTTLIQPDGDVVQSVSQTLLGPGHNPCRGEIARQHHANVQAAMAPLARVAAQGRAIEDLLVLLFRAGLGGAALHVPVSAGAWWLGQETVATLALYAGMPFLGAAAPMALRQGGRRLLRRWLARA